MGHPITSAWWAGSFEITQGWGATDFDGEPAGHGSPHWHAGVDVGAPCGTTIHLPSGIPSGQVEIVDNPGGYGTALVVHLGGDDVWLGHLRQRLVVDGAQVKAGDALGVSNNTGNSTGCHIHFEVRRTGGSTPADNGRYGSDVDPTSLLTAGVATQTQFDPLAGLGAEVTQAEQSFARVVISGGQVVVGTGLTLSGLLLAAYGLRGGTVAQASSMVRSRFGRSRRPGTRPSSPAPRPPNAMPSPSPIASAEGPETGARPSSSAASDARGARAAQAAQARQARMDARGARAAQAAQARQARSGVSAQRHALMDEVRSARAARRATAGGPGWTEATVRLRLAERQLAQLRGAAATRVRR